MVPHTYNLTKKYNFFCFPLLTDMEKDVNVYLRSAAVKRPREEYIDLIFLFPRSCDAKRTFDRALAMFVFLSTPKEDIAPQRTSPSFECCYLIAGPRVFPSEACTLRRDGYRHNTFSQAHALRQYYSALRIARSKSRHNAAIRAMKRPIGANNGCERAP